MANVNADVKSNNASLAHCLEYNDCLEQLSASTQGLSTEDAERRLAEEGPNALPQQTQRSTLMRFLRHFHNVLIYVLIASAAITASLGHWVDSGVILAVVIANAVIGFVQEGRAETAMSAIRSMLAPHASVLRGGTRFTVDATSLVRGDIVLLEQGDKVPADLRLIQSRALRIQEAVLTGESVPVDKGITPVASDVPLGDRSSMAYSGTLIAGGTGRGVVVATAANTEIGKISDLLRDVTVLTTPLVEQMNRFSRWLTAMILLVAAVLLTFGFFVEHISFEEMFMAVVGLTVAAIPEGLPAVLTITLAVGVQAMARRHVIVRRLPSIETLGAVSVICTDKTGTLTRNEMLLASVVTTTGDYIVTGEGYAPRGEISPLPEKEALHQAALVAALCNDAALHDVAGSWTVQGDPMEGALLAFAAKAGASKGHWSRIDEIPFDAIHRYMAVLVEDPDGGRVTLAKGAPEQILSMCMDQSCGTDNERLDTDFWHLAADRIAAQGQRVLAFAIRPADDDISHLENISGSLTFVGLAGLIDPPRTEVIPAIQECHSAGIAVKMITGDHVGTASAIGRQIGLKHADIVITGADIEKLSEAELATAVIDANIFARTSPEHKLRLVTALQAHGLIVAMTGDGANDSPALKRADAGIAMGITGSEAAKEAAELVLMDDNFASIEAAVREGRTVFDNLRKVISWTLPTNAGEAGTIMVALLLGHSLPISPVQILWVNLITAVTLGLALAFEPTETGTMKRPPRPRNTPLLTGGLIWHVIVVSILFGIAVFGLYTYAIDRGYSSALAQTMSMNMLVVLEIFHLFFIRNIYSTSLTWTMVRGTRAIWTCLFIVVGAQLMATYLPLAQNILGTEAIPLREGVLIVGIGAVFFAIIEVEKQLRLSIQDRGVQEAR